MTQKQLEEAVLRREDLHNADLHKVTCDVNDYNQHGEYFIACFKKKPTFEEFVKVYLKADGLRENYFEECDGIERVKSLYNNECYNYGISNTIYHLHEIKEGDIKVLE